MLKINCNSYSIFSPDYWLSDKYLIWVFILTKTVFFKHQIVVIKKMLIYHYCDIFRREVRKQCRIPAPLEHGKYQANPRVCPGRDNSTVCQLLPGTAAPEHWVLYYSCDPEYELSLMSRASICRGGQWLPSLPVCIPACKCSVLNSTIYDFKYYLKISYINTSEN